jgi:aryl-phospho-beta-D-glucosidase BglC (GH1 family)
VVVDLHSPPGGKATTSGYIGSDGGLFNNPQTQQKFIEVWRRIAIRYKHAKAIWGYDLANEPVEEESEEPCDDWQALAERTAQAIRSIDPERALIVEPSPWGGLQHKFDVPFGLGTPHLCGSEGFCRASFARKAAPKSVSRGDLNQELPAMNL